MSRVTGSGKATQETVKRDAFGEQLNSMGKRLKQVSNPIIGGGIAHGFARTFFPKYTKITSRAPSGLGVIFTGLALSFIGSHCVSDPTPPSFKIY